MKDVSVIEVHAWGRLVGAVALDPSVGYYAFEYDPAWKRTGTELAPFHMPLTDVRSTFVFPALPEATYSRLPALLADSLPDDFGNALIDAWMAQKGVDKSSITVPDRLAYMGKRGMGALEFRPARGAHSESSAPIEMKVLVEEARHLVQGTFSADREAKAALANIIRVGTSAGGARAKAVIAWNPQTDEVRSGQFDAAPGFEHWLLKFDGVGQDKELGTGEGYGRIEYAYYLMAQAAGIRMSDSRLLEENGRAHFMTKRFDREVVDGKTRKHHLQTLCAMNHLDFRLRGTHDYSQLFMTAAKLGLDDDAMSQIFRRMAFNVMARNCDDHTKNFAFILRQGAAWNLAPAYDVTHAYNSSGEWTYQHLMSVNQKFNDIAREDMMAVADRFGIRRPAHALSDIRAAIDNWSEYARQANLLPTLQDRIAKDLQLF
ncbi:MAG: type II toxin-antitoxin system HipA family toxin [Acidobacteriaceae bacterium]|nr:type II toxin-antitoxin system HipA family toxin [Acidobacteriaceae bacterium]